MKFHYLDTSPAHKFIGSKQIYAACSTITRGIGNCSKAGKTYSPHAERTGFGGCIQDARSRIYLAPIDTDQCIHLSMSKSMSIQQRAFGSIFIYPIATACENPVR